MKAEELKLYHKYIDLNAKGSDRNIEYIYVGEEKYDDGVRYKFIYEDENYGLTREDFSKSGLDFDEIVKNLKLKVYKDRSEYTETGYFEYISNYEKETFYYEEERLYNKIENLQPISKNKLKLYENYYIDDDFDIEWIYIGITDNNNHFFLSLEKDDDDDYYDFELFESDIKNLGLRFSSIQMRFYDYLEFDPKHDEYYLEYNSSYTLSEDEIEERVKPLLKDKLNNIINR